MGMVICISCEVSSRDLGDQANPHVLLPSPETVVWGYYWSETPPVLIIKSGDFVNVHTLITSSPSELEKLGIPPGEIENELRDVQSVKDRGRGPHVLTGPISIESAEPGDVLEVRIGPIELAIPYGYNRIGAPGFLSDEIFSRKSRVISLDRQGRSTVRHPGSMPEILTTKNW